jgi:hypothetical protein
LLTLYDPTAEFEFGLDLMLDGLEWFRDLRAAADRRVRGAFICYLLTAPRECAGSRTPASRDLTDRLLIHIHCRFDLTR